MILNFPVFTLIWIIFIGIVFPSNLKCQNLPEDMKRIFEKKKIIVAMYYEDVPPFFMHDKKGNFSGIDVELSKDIAKRLGVEVEFNRSAKTFDGIIEILMNREADVAISMLSKTLQRAIKVKFSDPYIILHQALLINRLKIAQQRRGNNPQIYLNHDSVKIGVIKGTSYVDYVKEDFPEAEHILFSDWNVAIQNVLDGNIFATLYDEIEVKKWLEIHPEGNLYLQSVFIKNKIDPIAFAVHYENLHFLSWLNAYLEKAKSNGTIDRLFETYLNGEKGGKI